MVWNRLPFFGMTDRIPSSPLIFLGLATQVVQYGGLLEPIVVFVFGMHHLLHIS